MSNFAPAISMKRRSTRFAAAVMTSGALIAAGLGGASSPATASNALVDVDCVQVVNVVCQSLNHNEILTIHTGDILSGNQISILSDNLSNNELTVENVANILSNNNIKCSTFVLSIAGVTQTKQCTW